MIDPRLRSLHHDDLSIYPSVQINHRHGLPSRNLGGLNQPHLLCNTLLVPLFLECAYQEIDDVLKTPGRELIRGAQNIAEGMPEMFAEDNLTKFRPGGLHIVRAGGKAGMFSAIIGGWVASGPIGSQSVTKEITL